MRSLPFLLLILVAGCNVGYDPDSVPLECAGPSCETDTTADGMVDQAIDVPADMDEDAADAQDMANDSSDSQDLVEDAPDVEDTDVQDMDVAQDLVQCGPTTCSVDETCCSGGGQPTCVDLDTSQQNCGTCGNVCTPGTVCGGGECHCDNPAGDVCADQGDRCNGATCVCGQAQKVCAPGEVCEANQCR